MVVMVMIMTVAIITANYLFVSRCARPIVKKCSGTCEPTAVGLPVAASMKVPPWYGNHNPYENLCALHADFTTTSRTLQTISQTHVYRNCPDPDLITISTSREEVAPSFLHPC